MRHLGKWAAVLSVALLVAGSSASISSASANVATTPPALGAASIPWGDVGPGWLLGVWSPNKPIAPGVSHPGYRQHPPQIVFLVSPTGVRYEVVREPNNFQYIEAWSGDGRRVLQATPGLSSISQINLATGRAFDRFSVHGSRTNMPVSVVYSNPDG